jgi:hypothetical protein
MSEEAVCGGELHYVPELSRTAASVISCILLLSSRLTLLNTFENISALDEDHDEDVVQGS